MEMRFRLLAGVLSGYEKFVAAFVGSPAMICSCRSLAKRLRLGYESAEEEIGEGCSFRSVFGDISEQIQRR